MSQKVKETSDIKPLIMTIGHSTRSFEELLELLKANQVTMLVDVRSIPRSRTNPQFNKETLSESLPEHGIHYVHLTELGGLRHTRRDSHNTIWQNPSFRGFADYMETEPFGDGIETIVHLAKRNTIALMCSEAVWWRCHRSMIADELVAEGYPVEHIVSVKGRRAHTLRRFAHVNHGHVEYHAS